MPRTSAAIKGVGTGKFEDSDMETARANEKAPSSSAKYAFIKIKK
jgi:hypothetical protein